MPPSRQLRVLGVGSLYPPHHFGGYETIWEAATDDLRARGHVVRVLATDFRHEGPTADASADVGVHRELRWYWHDHDFPRMSGMQRLALERHNAAVLRRHLDEFSPDVVLWTAMGGMSLSMLEQVRRAGIPAAGFVADKWMAYGFERDGWLHAWGRRPRLAGVVARLTGIPTHVDLQKVARWLFISATTRETLEREVALDVPDSGLAHSGVDPKRFPAHPGRPWEWRLLYAGRIDERKGIWTAVEALPLLPDTATLRIHGGGDDEHAAVLRARVAELGLSDRVQFTGPSRDDLDEVYAWGDVLLFPVTWDEPWGLVPLEAMSVGRPVIATGTGGSSEYLRDGENCLLFEPGDPASLAAAITRLAGDEELRSKLVQTGFETARHFSEDAFHDVLEAELMKVSARRR